MERHIRVRCDRAQCPVCGCTQHEGIYGTKSIRLDAVKSFLPDGRPFELREYLVFRFAKCRACGTGRREAALERRLK